MAKKEITTTVTTTVTTTNQQHGIRPELTVIEGQVFCTSLQIAEHFEREHFNVIRDIEEQIAKVQAGRHAGSEAQMFQRGEYEISAGFGKVKKPMFLLNRDGFMKLVMGYNGQKASDIQMDYIAAFNQMEGALLTKPAIECITTTQLKALRAQMENVTRYMQHDKQSLAQTLYRCMKAEFGYDKIENLPATDLPRALDYIASYQDVAHHVWGITNAIERGFIQAVKQQQKAKPNDIYRDVLASLEAPLRLALAA